MQTKRINSPSQLATASEKRLTRAERDLLRLRLSAGRELLLPKIVAKLQDAARNAQSRELKLVFVKALMKIWRGRPDLRPKALAEENQ